jgi:nucleoside-diphosphate-sugar epimerase
MTTVAVSGTTSAIGRRIAEALRHSDSVTRVVALDDPGRGMGDLKRQLAGADVVVLAAWGEGRPATDEAAARASLDDTRSILEAAGDVHHVVLLSSATVYGAWADNRVPLTEDAPLRPNPGAHQPVARAEAERLVADWADEHPAALASILRPTVIVGADQSWTTSVLGGLTRVRPKGSSRPVQFLHIDDLATAVARVVVDQRGGTFNVAPDGWLGDETARELTGRGLRVPLPARLARAVTGAPAGLMPYVLHPWVVANDRLRGTGWVPAWTAEEAVVAAVRPSRWQRLSPSRRQELALGASVAAIGGLGIAVALLVRARRRRRS